MWVKSGPLYQKVYCIPASKETDFGISSDNTMLFLLSRHKNRVLGENWKPLRLLSRGETRSHLSKKITAVAP